jgi:cyanophycin synthetase
MLRRGLVIDRCDAALITNVASDHLGEYGVHTVAEMARVKGLVCRAVHAEGRCILNGDDPLVRRLGADVGAPVCWFSLEGVSDWLRPHLDAGGAAWVLERGWLCAYVGRKATRVVEAAQIPATHGGAARHNIANALGAAALSQALGASFEDVRQGLMSFGSEATDNPGRCQIQEIAGVQLILDFGHNPHGVRAMLTMAHALINDRPGARLWVSVGQAGDRSDEDLLGLSDAIWEARPAMVSLRDIVGYERGRAPQEAALLMRDGLIRLGHSVDAVRLHDDEVHAISDALSWAQPGDLIVHLVHIQRDDVAAFLADPAR